MVEAPRCARGFVYKSTFNIALIIRPVQSTHENGRYSVIITYVENEPTAARAIADLRRSVGWNGMEECYNNPLMNSYYHIACYDDGKLVGYVDSVSNGVTDAYIQDLAVHPEYQGQGIGTELMNRIIAKLKENRVFWISVSYDEMLQSFYKRFGFVQMLCGTIQTYEHD
jgi:ribosomal protein S18 acetylase RimI-like enzyme